MGENRVMSESSLVKAFRDRAPGHPWVSVGPGHDAAIIEWKADRDAAFKIDSVVEGVHFVLEGEGAATPEQVGWKAAARALSDIAAVGFDPVAIAAAVAIRSDFPEDFALRLFDGLSDCCCRFGCAVAGGDMSSTRGPVTVVVSAIGAGPRGGAFLRKGASPGDALFVTGELGGSLAGRHLSFVPRLAEARRLRALGVVRAMTDISDGLARDLRHICEESGVGAVVEEAALPVSADAYARALRGKRPVMECVLGDGEDYELLFAVSGRDAARLAKEWDMPARLTRIGWFVVREKGILLCRPDGTVTPMPAAGYDHFRRPGGGARPK
ncbi:MAG: thiamine-phosphate kinase [Planctomycetota bacterium]|nr:thiamine-phosphate kinase [Planctomycetota bacterium]